MAQSWQSVAEVGLATAYCPAGQFRVLPHSVAVPPADQPSAGHAVQPSVSFVAPVGITLAYSAFEQAISEHVVAEPPAENEPTAQISQSVALTAPILLATEPASQLLVRHAELAPPGEYSPGMQVIQPAVSVVAAISVEYSPAGQFWLEQPVGLPPKE